MVGLRIQTTSFGPGFVSTRQHVEMGKMKITVFRRRCGEAHRAGEEKGRSARMEIRVHSIRHQTPNKYSGFRAC